MCLIAHQTCGLHPSSGEAPTVGGEYLASPTGGGWAGNTNESFLLAESNNQTTWQVPRPTESAAGSALESLPPNQQEPDRAPAPDDRLVPARARADKTHQAAHHRLCSTNQVGHAQEYRSGHTHASF